MEPSTISGLSVDGSALDIEPSTMRGISMEGALLRYEPSMMRGGFVEGSGLRNGTYHGFDPQRGWFRSGD